MELQKRKELTQKEKNRRYEKILTRYIEKIVSKSAHKYNSGDADSSIISYVVSKKDKVFSCYYHNVGLDKDFLLNLDDIVIYLIRKQFCPAFHVLNSLDVSGAKEHGYVYVIENENGHIKIGRTISPKKRIRTIETTGGYSIVNSWISKKTHFFDEIERKSHKVFQDRRIRGEWFNVNFNTAVLYVEDIIKNT